MKIDITPEDIQALNNIPGRFKEGYLQGLKGCQPPIPDAEDYQRALARLGYASGNRIRELNELGR